MLSSKKTKTEQKLETMEQQWRNTNLKILNIPEVELEQIFIKNGIHFMENHILKVLAECCPIFPGFGMKVSMF